MKSIIFVSLLIIICVCNSSSHSSSSTRSDSDSSNSNDDHINVFLIAHSHCDVGWLETYNQYYTENVTHILTNVMPYLIKDPSKRFVWAEIVYFERWWNEQTALMQSAVRGLVDGGQIEFVGGGFAQNDEALTHYEAILNQNTLGHQFLLSTFGVKPQVGWQIDPFGPSTMTAQLFKLMGFKGHIINRLDMRIKNIYNNSTGIVTIEGSGEMITNRSFEFTWYPSPNYDTYQDDFSIFTHVLDNHYSPPSWCYPNATDPSTNICTGYDFEYGGDMNPAINESNIAERADTLMLIIRTRASYYRHNNLLLPFGNDFRYQDPGQMFDNMDLLIEYINANASYGATLQYATVSEYFAAVDQSVPDPQEVFPVLQGGHDYYTYTMCLTPDYQNFNTCVNYWAGYYTSYPLLKQTIRQSDYLLRSAEVLFSIGTAVYNADHNIIDEQKCYDIINMHRNISSILTHHDALPGTARTVVREDYMNMLEQAQNDTYSILPQIVGQIMANTSVELGYMDMSSGALASLADGQLLVVTVTNNLAWNRVEYLALESGTIQNYAVFDYNLNPVVSQVIQSVGGPTNWTLYFEVNVPAIGASSYFIVGVDSNVLTTKDRKRIGQVVGLQDPDNIILSHRSYPINGKEKQLSSLIVGNNVYNLQFQVNNGNGGLLELVGYEDLVEGGVTIPLHQHLVDNNASQVFTVFNQTSQASGTGAQESDYILIENKVAVGWDREIVMRFDTTAIDNNQTFYSNNGLEAMKREYSVKFNDTHPWSMVSGNYFPVINMAMIQDLLNELVILNRQSMGGSSQSPGSLEVMLIRRSNYTQPSIGQKMNDTSTVTIAHRILFGRKTTRDIIRTPHSIVHENPVLPLVALVETGQSMYNYSHSHRVYYEPLSTGQQFPANLHLLTLAREWLNSPAVLLRLVNIYEVGQSSEYSQPSSVAVSSLFGQSFNISNVDQTTASGNSIIAPQIDLPLVVTLNPIEIKTFMLDFQSIVNNNSNSNIDDIQQQQQKVDQIQIDKDIYLFKIN
ncbi:hypothetical protein DFA_02102 [Cavenderia fasciculata]|uniref:Alpha-mannosidase n=1 Tax=Cavenderia fasciculata TaxID=261658 RepID=F4PYP9_CACFS|nr:uncharacterized protein DFA_02102 [Cavenderia fasciculata]EGG19315.1 hypothetical protein DFA_02102 [Cavenderia fasciculata]|eukprot:XP_004357586.1 hypothetical protein DFA_02102 [Cavenderia fasciculata]